MKEKQVWSKRECAGYKFRFGRDECEVSAGYPNGDVEKATDVAGGAGRL